MKYATDAIRQIEANGAVDAPAILNRLRNALGLTDFGELMISAPNAEFPNLSSALPAMASDQVQDAWTGSHGLPLLKQSLSFVQCVAYNFSRIAGRPLEGARILDYGCGYGRLARLMYFFTDRDMLFGVDPWDKSIELCRSHGMGENFRQSAYLPESLPLPEAKFDLVYAFSVFTHLSERATRAALAACRRYISDNGLLAITIRPIEYWSLNQSIHGLKDTSALREAHAIRGFAYSALRNAAGEDGGDYGNTSLTIDWLAANFQDWRIRGVDRSLDDPYQIYVFMTPK